ncbi:MAG: hypothetical protein ACRDOY_00470 [Nocardioidaceae bacterium]
MTEPPRAPKVFVHIGAPKTGTTFVQDVLWTNRDQLGEDGILYPYERRHQHFEAMLDLREKAWGSRGVGHTRGSWDAVAARLASWSGPAVVIGNELLAGATVRQIKRLADSLAPAEVHVVFTARDFARQLVSDWQEHIKHRHTLTLEAFVDDLIEHGEQATPPFGELFWGLHDAAGVLDRWARVIPRERIHLITLPPPGAPRDTLWRRFCSVTGLDPDRYSVDIPPSNTSLGRAEAEVIRRVNGRVRRVKAPYYDVLVRMKLSRHVLDGSGGRIVLPEGRMPWVRARSRDLVKALADGGYDVVGDLDDLIPRPEDHEGYVPTEAIRPREMLPVALKTTAALLRIAARQQARIRRLRRKLGQLAPDPEPPPPGVRTRLRGALSGARRRLRRR